MTKPENKVKVTDKRKFDKDGNLVMEKSAAEEKKAEGEPKADSKKKKTKQTPKVKAAEQTAKESTQEKADGGKSYEKAESAPVDFIQFLLSLYSSVAVNIGEVPDPVTGKTVKHLESAKQMIDIIAMLKDKTSGNLTEDEIKVIDEVLYQARMLYLKHSDGIKT